MRFAVVAAMALLVGGPSSARMDQALSIRIVRLFQADGQRSSTRVKAFVEIPFASFAAAPDNRLSLKAVARVTDSAGTLLHEDKWELRPRAPGALDNLYSVEILDFAVVPGRFDLAITVQDSVTGKTLTGSADFDGFNAGPSSSDLMLAPMMRTAPPDSAAHPGEWRYGSDMLVTAASTVHLTPTRSRLFYLIEAYSQQPDTGTMQVTVLDSTGHTMVKSPPRPVSVGSGGGVLRGASELAGLPAGNYQLATDLTMGGHTTRRTAPFEMGGLEAAATRQLEDRQTDEGYFAAMRERELDLAEAPLVYIQKKNELSVYKTLSPAGKAKFLADFWRQRDPTPQTPINEAREQFYQAIAIANQRFGEEGHDVEQGWRTDRGRIFLKQGDPRDTKRREAKGNQPALALWNYNSKGRWYIFADNSNNNVYHLVASNDLSEPGEPNWYERFDHDALVELGQYFGVDFFSKYQITR